MPLSDKILFSEVLISTLLVITLILLVIIKRKEITSSIFIKRLEEKRSLVKTILYLIVIALFVFVNTELLEFISPYFVAEYSFYFDKAIKVGGIVVVLMNIITQSLGLYLFLRSKPL